MMISTIKTIKNLKTIKAGIHFSAFFVSRETFKITLLSNKNINKSKIIYLFFIITITANK